MNTDELKVVTEKANKIFKEIRSKYIGLSGHLVFSSPEGQCELTSNIMKILEKSPDMIQPSIYKDRALEIISTIAAMRNDKKDNVSELSSKIYERWEQAMTELEPFLDKLEIRDDIIIEIKFNRTDINLTFKLQNNNLISQDYKPQTNASLRIVFGTLKEIKQDSKHK